MLSESPSSAIATNAPRNATGRPIAAQIAKPGRKNRLMMATTRTRPIAPFLTSISRRSRTMLVRSCTTSIRRVSGSAARSTSRSPATASRTASASAPSGLCTASSAARSPSSSARSSAGAEDSSIAAIWPSFSSAPFGRERIVRSARPAAVLRSSAKRRRSSCRSVSSVPAGRSTLCAPMARASDAALSPCWESTARGTVIRNCRSPKPDRSTCATPGSAAIRS